MRAIIRWFSLGLTMTLLLVAAQAVAQKPYVRPTEGVLLVSPVTTEVNDATALSVNPAHLGFLDAWNLVYTGARVSSSQEHQSGQGQALFFAVPLGPVGFGIGTEFMLPTDSVRRWQGLDRRMRFSMGLSFNPVRALGLGFAWRTFPGYDFGAPIHTLDFGVSVRPINHVSLSFLFQDVNSPKVTYGQVKDDETVVPRRTEKVPNRYTIALTIRPTGTDRISLGGEVHYMNGARKAYDADTGTFLSMPFQRTDFQAHVGVTLTDGISLRTRFTAEGVRSEDVGTAYYLDTALVVDTARFPFGLGVAPYFKLAPDYQAGYQGMSAMLQFSGDDRPSLPLLAPPALVAPIRLDENMTAMAWADWQRRLERIQSDRSVDAVLFELAPDALNLSYARELRRRIRELKAREIATVCYLKEASTAAYAACAGSDQVWIHPAGGIRTSGLSMRAVYFRSLLDKVGVQADIVRMGEYKSAPEMFTETAPTAPAAKAINRYLDGLYRTLTAGIAEDRGMSGFAAAADIIEQGPFLATEALEAGLVDRLVSTERLEAELEALLGRSAIVYDRYDTRPQRHRTYIDAPAVAVVHVQGDLVDGESLDIPFLRIRTTGAETLTKTLRSLADNPAIRAVVVRIDSPGGSALAADIIWGELMALRQHKPVIATLGAVAASGAYYIASAAGVIYAAPTTLPGSIGVVYGKADVSGLLDKLGISVTTFRRGDQADAQSWARAYTDGERAQLERQLESYYHLFLDRVVEGRDNGLTRETLDKRARGRIWNGIDARQHLLVDELGGYQEALNHARALSFVKPGTRVLQLPVPQKNLLMRLMKKGRKAQEMSAAEALLLPAELRHYLGALAPFALFSGHTPMARLPFSLEDDR